MAPPVGPVQPQSPPSLPQETPEAPVSDQKIQQTAEDVLKTGDRPIIADDYDGRSVHFAEEMAKLSPADQSRLLQEVLKQDTGAMHSWLKLDILDRMQNEGRISQQEYEAVASGFAEGYNNGSISQQEAETFLQAQALTNHPPGMVPDQMAQMKEFLGAMGNGPGAQQFREGFAQSLLAKAATDQIGTSNFHASGLAMQIASDSGDPDMAARIFNNVLEQNGGSEATRTKLLEALGNSSVGFRNSQGAAEGIVNPMSTLIDSVARQPNTTQWNDVAVAIAKYANGSSAKDVFFDYTNDNKPHPDTAQSLSRLLGSTHGNAILTELTKFDQSGVAGGNGHAQAFGRNAIELGNLLRITAFNPDNPASGDAMKTIQDWTQMRKDFLNGVQRNDYPSDMSVATAREQLAMLGGAAFDSVQQMKIDKDNREAATQALVSFGVDLALSAIPGGGKLTSLMTDDLKATFNNNSTINGLIEKALDGGDTLTSAGIDQLKKDISGAISGGDVDLEVLRTTASSFVTNSIVAGLPGGTQQQGQSHRDIVSGNIQNVQDDIQDNRAK